MTPLILVDGPRSEFRSKVAVTLAERYVTMHCIGNIGTTPETYVRMMTPAIDQVRPVVIECSWITQELHQHKLNPIAQSVFHKHAAQRRMLYRLALGCGAISIRCLDMQAPLYEAWTLAKEPLLNELTIGDWDEYLMQDIEYKLMQARNPGPGIGHWARHESILLVGDQHGDTVQPYNVQKNIAFCSMSGQGCSEWLAEQMAPFNERDFYWINARDPKAYGGRATPHAFVHDLNPYAVVAMGNTAEQWCERAGVPYRSVPHPQWWKRFHFKEQYPLIPLLTEIFNARYSGISA